MGIFRRESPPLVDPAAALPGRAASMPIPAVHRVLGVPLIPPADDDVHTIVLGMGCFWGAEEIYWQIPGVVTTAVGYAGGTTPNPTYEEVCSGRTGHTEAVLVAYRPGQLSLDEVLARFWEGHDPTQGMRQGNDIGTQYRSAIYTTRPHQLEAAAATASVYEPLIQAAGYGPITTEIAPLETFYYAEPYHQQYLDANPHGYRCHSASGVPFPRMGESKE
jgi:peptide-methionine (S)-S-oxide reductase